MKTYEEKREHEIKNKEVATEEKILVEVIKIYFIFILASDQKKKETQVKATTSKQSFTLHLQRLYFYLHFLCVNFCLPIIVNYKFCNIDCVVSTPRFLRV